MMRVIWLIAGLNRRMMKVIFALALIAYIACKYTTGVQINTFNQLDNLKATALLFMQLATIHNTMGMGRKATWKIYFNLPTSVDANILDKKVVEASTSAGRSQKSSLQLFYLLKVKSMLSQMCCEPQALQLKTSKTNDKIVTFVKI